MNIIDTHCHLYLQEFKDDIVDVIAKAERLVFQNFICQRSIAK